MDPALAMALATLGGALLLDTLVGEYAAAMHPVVWIGKIITWILKIAPQSGWWSQFVFGVFLALAVPAGATLLTILALRLSGAVLGLNIVVGVILLKASFALSELGAAAERVRAPVAAGDLPRARQALRSLCSRDPEQFDGEALLGATIQSLAENISDSVVAPLFYFMLLGIPGAMAYRAINTLDAMVGYRGPYEALGKASALLDDLANFIPARITAGSLLLVGTLTGLNVANGWRIFWRDRRKTPSPNGGRPMAMAAGLLGVQLEKQGVYTLGEPIAPLQPLTVTKAWRLVSSTGWLAAGLCALGIVFFNKVPGLLHL